MNAIFILLKQLIGKERNTTTRRLTSAWSEELKLEVTPKLSMPIGLRTHKYVHIFTPLFGFSQMYLKHFCFSSNLNCTEDSENAHNWAL